MKLDGKAVKRMRLFTHGVLTTIDEDGYPFSLPVKARLKPSLDALELEGLRWFRLRGNPGQKAYLLFHFHDDKVWSQRQLSFRGQVHEEGGEKWVFTPTIKGRGFYWEVGFLNPLKVVINGRRRAREFCRRRGLELGALIKEMRRTLKEIKPLLNKHF